MRQRVVKNVAGSGGKWLDVAPERLPRWIESFTERHQHAAAGTASLTIGIAPAHVTFTAPDGAVAQCHPPFPESLPGPLGEPGEPGTAGPSAAHLAGALAAHAMTPRTVGVLLVRLGGYAAGVFTGYPPRLADAKAGSRLVHGRSAAGGWSQHRFARRREKQANEALQAAADTALAIFARWQPPQEITARGAAAPNRQPEQRPTGPAGHGALTGLDALILGGDKRAVADLRDDPRLARYFAIATDRFLTVPDPKRAVLEASPRLFLAIRIRLTEPDPVTRILP
jgi:hypothetical protein